MISVLIPIFNFDVRQFVKELSDQSALIQQPIEIVCLDDASASSFATLNAEIGDYPFVNYQISNHNLGRSGVRNKLVNLAKYDHLLFLDCDGRCVSDLYLSNYISQIASYDVIYGGRTYSEYAPDDHKLYFHWYIGSNREAVLMENRRKSPYKSFMTNNFMIRKEVYEKVKMNERLVGYGHEDTLFAIELKNAGFKIEHIDNPIEHIGIEPVDIFLEKSENGVRNLAVLIQEKKVGDSIRLVWAYNKLERFKALSILGVLARLFERSCIQNFKGPAPSLWLFDFWKLGRLKTAMQDA